MVNWLSSMQQTFEFYEVDPVTWGNKQRLDDITACTINRDSSEETCGHATIDCTNDSRGEYYIRIYLVTIQNGITERHPLGTYLVQTPTGKTDGRVTTVSLDAYSPLIELKETMPPIGYTITKNSPIMELASSLTRENLRAPVVTNKTDGKLISHFVSELDDTWMTFLSDLIAKDKKHFDIDEMGRILFAPTQDLKDMMPRFTFNDDNSSILYPDVTLDKDLFGIPNVIEVIYTEGNNTIRSVVRNEDTNSPVSIPSRGREIVYRDTSPSINGVPNQTQLDKYAESLLKSMSTLECTLTFTHGYYPVRVGDCVRLNYKKAGLENVKAKIIRQSIKCEPGCPVTETAVYNATFWR